MYFNQAKQGFTLIELLVVVLIIGILTAVALPQYQKAVYKSRFIQAKLASKSITEAEELFYLANNAYTDDISKLDLSLNPTSVSANISYYPWGEIRLIIADSVATVDTYIIHEGNRILEYDVRLAHSPFSANVKYCIAWTTDNSSVLAQVCQNETDRKQGVCNGNYCSYMY